MPAPRRGDPRRPLHLAAASCRVLGLLFLLGGTCTGVTTVAMLSRVRLGPGGRAGSLPAALLPTVVAGSVGVAYLVFAACLKRRQFWAVVAALSVTGAGALLFLVGVAFQLVTLFAFLHRPQLPPEFLVMLGVQVLILVALGQLIYHLARSFEAIKHVAPDEGRGFDVLPMEVHPAADDRPE